jgi:hypothetical protein
MREMIDAKRAALLRFYLEQATKHNFFILIHNTISYLKQHENSHDPVGRQNRIFLQFNQAGDEHEEGPRQEGGSSRFLEEGKRRNLLPLSRSRASEMTAAPMPLSDCGRTRIAANSVSWMNYFYP